MNTPRPRPEAPSHCPWRDRVVQSTVFTESEGDTTEAHRAGCEPCSRLYRETVRLVEVLRALPQVEDRDLSENILSRLPAQKAWTWRDFLRSPFFRMACGLALLLGSMLFGLRHPREAPEPPPGRSTPDLVLLQEPPGIPEIRSRAVAWLYSLQREDGSWDVDPLGGSPRHSPALTALALMALHDQEDETLLPALRKGADVLIAMQRPDGVFGLEDPFLMYNHGMATVALLRLHRDGVSSRLQEPLEAAVAFIREAQHPEGGWGYLPGASGGPANASVSAWQLDALGLARSLGWGDDGGQLRRGLFWLSRLADSRNIVGYQRPGDWPSVRITTTALALYCLAQSGDGMEGVRPVAMKLSAQLQQLLEIPGALDDPNPYRDYFAARASQAVRTSSLRIPTRPKESRVQEKLADAYGLDGNGSSWMPKDPYARVGGALYATSLSVLALRQ